MNFFPLLLAISSLPYGELSNCDRGIIRAIHYLWYEKGMPNSILDKLIKHGSAIVVGTNKDYIKDEDEIRCLKQTYHKDYQTPYRYYNNGSEVIRPNTILTECKGMVYTPIVAMRRFFLPLPESCGVMGLYRCYDNDKDGVAEGQVMVYEDGHDPEAVELAIKMLADVGVIINKFYPSVCP